MANVTDNPLKVLPMGCRAGQALVAAHDSAASKEGSPRPSSASTLAVATLSAAPSINTQPASTRPLPARQKEASGRAKLADVRDVFRHFNSNRASFGMQEAMRRVQSTDADHDVIAYFLVVPSKNPRWKDEATLWIKGGDIALLPDYNKYNNNLYPAQMERDDLPIAGWTKGLGHYGLADGPEFELHDDHGNVSDFLVPEDFPGALKYCRRKRLDYYNKNKAKQMADKTRTHRLPPHPMGMELTRIPAVVYKPETKPAVAVFIVCSGRMDKVVFWAWATIAKVKLFAPGSVALAEFMRIKWGTILSPAKRGEWRADFEEDWAWVKLNMLDADAPECPPPPVIVRFGPRGAGQHERPAAAAACKADEGDKHETADKDVDREGAVEENKAVGQESKNKKTEAVGEKTLNAAGVEAAAMDQMIARAVDRLLAAVERCQTLVSQLVEQ